MAKIDIRADTENIDEIEFADGFSIIGGDIKLEIVEGVDRQLFTIRWCDVENLIKALQKAVELGWTK